MGQCSNTMEVQTDGIVQEVLLPLPMSFRAALSCQSRSHLHATLSLRVALGRPKLMR